MDSIVLISDRCKLVQDPGNFIAGRPKAAPLVWFFSDFRCGVPLFIVIHSCYI